MRFVFGPVPSRRLGRSLGINNIPPKICSYTCVYCQLGNTIKLSNERRAFYEPDQIIAEVEEAIKRANENNEKIDYLTIVPDGEPTLDLRIGELISGLKKFGIKTALITNSSHLYLEEVRVALKELDWLSVKVDSVTEKTWRKIDRSHGKIDFADYIEGLRKIAQEFPNSLNTETMLVKGLNDSNEELTATAKFITKLNPDAAYISVPTRPPAESFAVPPESTKITEAYGIFSEFIKNVELNISYEGGNFSTTGNFVNDFLSIISVHPMREDALESLLEKENVPKSAVDDLVEKEIVLKHEYLGKIYYVRNLRKAASGSFS